MVQCVRSSRTVFCYKMKNMSSPSRTATFVLLLSAVISVDCQWSPQTAEDDCDLFPFFDEPAWKEFTLKEAPTVKSHSHRDPPWVESREYTLQVELPKMSAFVSTRGDACLSKGNELQFLIDVKLDGPGGSTDNITYQCSYKSIR